MNQKVGEFKLPREKINTKGTNKSYHEEMIKLDNEPGPQTQYASSSGPRVILRIKTFFPVDFFPDELLIEEDRIIHIKRTGPFTKKINSILIRQISQSRCFISLFFGELQVEDLFNEVQISITTLPRKKALLVKNLLDNLQLREEHRRKGSPHGKKSGHDLLAEIRKNPVKKMFDTGW